MGFKIKADGAIFEWYGSKLHCTDDIVMKLFKDLLSFHIPEVVAIPGVIDYDDDLTDGRNAYYAILGIFEDCEILKTPSKEFLDEDYVKGRIY